MRPARLTRLIQLALAPTVAMGLSIGVHAESATHDSQQKNATAGSTQSSAQTSGSQAASQAAPHAPAVALLLDPWRL